jgi:hypothetical protein
LPQSAHVPDEKLPGCIFSVSRTALPAQVCNPLRTLLRLFAIITQKIPQINRRQRQPIPQVSDEQISFSSLTQ